ncbi:hypothetical protein V1514DRAFT_351445 [Lipomyces japonicus]|uniref:uncharacterized protein n=1 Tax=Lipomyces japonicus TaxID=56871 RepID=UPI0034CD5D49
MPARATSPPSISSASSFVNKPFRFWQRRQDDHASTVFSSGNKIRRWWSFSNLRRLAASLFGFNVLPVTILAVATYASLLITTYVIQFANPQTASAAAVSAAPGTYSQDVETAWYDLQIISEHIHPYNAHGNDYVHDYILNRTWEIYYKSKPGRVEVDNDYGRNITFRQADLWNATAPSGKIIYYESNNILVKVIGRDPNLSAVLVSAHFDSVATAYGTTDDGTGIVTLLGILEHYAYADQQPLRTIIFNFNNAEEFGLYGAEAFFFHPWSELVSTFYNLEGTGAGGRAVLFRASDYGVADHYSAADTPHANSLLQEGFEHGVIRSETDYRAYENHGLRGLDVAFYTPRSTYHTKGDSIQGTTRGSVEHMFTTSLATVDAMVEDPDIDNSSKSKAVFFDLFGEALFVAPVQTFFIVDTVMLVVTPIILFLLLFGLAKSRKLNVGRRGWGRFPLSIIVSTAIMFGVLTGLRYANGLVIYSYVGLPFLALFSLYFVLNYVILKSADRLFPVRHQKFKILLELYFAWWVVLVYANVMENKMSGTGLYWITFNFVGVSVALLLDIIGLYFEPAAPMYFMARQEVIGSENQYMQERDEDIDHISPRSEHEEDDDDADSEDAPLLGENASVHRSSYTKKISHRVDFVWLYEFLILVPFSVFLTSQLGFLALAAVQQTLQEGGPSIYNVYLSLFVFVIIVTYPILPFIHRINFVVPLVLGLTFIGTYIASAFLFPFSAQKPLKVSFVQQVDLDNLDAGAVVSVSGLSPYVRNVVEDLPSVKNYSFYNEDYYIDCQPNGVGVQKCRYPGLYPNVTYGYPYDWLNVTAFNGSFYNFTYYDDNETSPAPVTELMTVNELIKTQVLKRRWEGHDDQIVTLGDDDDNNVSDTYNATIKIYVNNSRSCVVQFTPPFDRFEFSGFSPYENSTKYGNHRDDEEEELSAATVQFGKYVVTSVSVTTNATKFAWWHNDTTHDEVGDYEEPVVISYDEGIDKISLFKLDWWSPFIVTLGYETRVDDENNNNENVVPSDDQLKVYVGCQWAEWKEGKIPALDELDKYRPGWVAVTKSGNGLVEVWKEIYLDDYSYETSAW